MGRSPCRDKNGLKKGPWTPEEDESLVKYIQKNGHESWTALPRLAGLNRCGKSCRLRWTNYLRPDIKRGKFSQEEEQTILKLHSILGNKWSAIATHLPGRTDNEIKNYWNTYLKKKLIKTGIDPMTHKPRTDVFLGLPHLIAMSNLKEVMRHRLWDENALRVQAEAAQFACLQLLHSLLHPQQTSSLPTAVTDDVDHHIPILDTTTLANAHTSISENPVLNSQILSSLGSSSLQEVNESIPFSCMPDLQIPSSSHDVTPDKDIMTQIFHDFTLLSNGKTSPNSEWIPPSGTQSLPLSANLHLTEAPFSNLGDDAGNGSNNEEGTSLMWADLLLEDVLSGDIA